jgi:hypothetical protein
MVTADVGASFPQLNVGNESACRVQDQALSAPALLHTSTGHNTDESGFTHPT